MLLDGLSGIKASGVEVTEDRFQSASKASGLTLTPAIAP